jgi:hypothetical protein
MSQLRLAFVVLALVSFVLSTAGVAFPRLNLTPLGLFFWALSTIIPAH